MEKGRRLVIINIKLQYDAFFYRNKGLVEENQTLVQEICEHALHLFMQIYKNQIF